MLMDKSKARRFFKNWLLAATAGAFVRTITSPIERVKMILQTQDLSPQFWQLDMKRYQGFWECFSRLPKEQGILSYWRGHCVNMIRYLPTVAFSFAFNDLFKEYIVPYSKENMSFWNYLGREMLCGALAGGAAHSLVQPLRLCHTLMCTDLSTRRTFLGLSDCFVKIYKRHGISGFYAGYTSSVVGVSLYRSVYFGIFQTSKTQIDSYYGKRRPLYLTWAVAQATTLLASILSYPLDTISRNQHILLMSNDTDAVSPKFANIVHTIAKEKGILGFYKGILVNSFKSVGSSLVLVFYDEIQYRLFGSQEKVRKSLVTNREKKLCNLPHSDGTGNS